VPRGHPSSSVWTGIREERLVEIWFPDQISGPPEGWRSAIRRVAMFLAIIEGNVGDPFFREWKASSIGQCWNLAAASRRDARAVMPRNSSSLRICVQDRTAVLQMSSHIVGMLRPISFVGPWSPARGKELGRPHICRESLSRRESTALMASGDSVMRQCVWAIFECTP
jgi:hypothetical protein